MRFMKATGHVGVGEGVKNMGSHKIKFDRPYHILLHLFMSLPWWYRPYHPSKDHITIQLAMQSETRLASEPYVWYFPEGLVVAMRGPPLRSMFIQPIPVHSEGWDLLNLFIPSWWVSLDRKVATLMASHVTNQWAHGRPRYTGYITRQLWQHQCDN